MDPLALILIIIVCLLIGLLLGAWSTRQRSTRNKDQAWNEAPRYVVQDNPFNSPSRQAFTPGEINQSGARAQRNPEDFRS